MNKGSKYFFIRNTGIKQVHELAKWNERYYVLVDENIEYYQCIFLEIDTTSGSIYPKPKSSEYQKVKPILKELFDDYYSQSLVYIGNIDIDDGEFYIINRLCCNVILAKKVIDVALQRKPKSKSHHGPYINNRKQR